MKKFGCFYLDNEKDMVVNLEESMNGESGKHTMRLFYELTTPNHQSGNLIRNFASLCHLPLKTNPEGLLVIRGEIPCYLDSDAREVFILRFGGTKVANIYPDGTIERKAAVPSIAKTLMSQTKEYHLSIENTIFKTYIPRDLKFETDLHTHMNGILAPDILIALGIVHQIRYPLYYIKKLNLALTHRQSAFVEEKRAHVAKQFVNSGLKGKYLDRKINDNTFLNFADLILGNISCAKENIRKIRSSLAIMKDGQAVFTNLEKVYLYRYVFTKGKSAEETYSLNGIDAIPDSDIVHYVHQMMQDRKDPRFAGNTVFQDKLLWIARQYRAQGIRYAEISDTTLVKKYESLHMLQEVHEVMPYIYEETGVRIRFLAAIRRIPLTIIKDQVTPADYLQQNLSVLSAVCLDPYVAGCDIVGEEISDIRELSFVIKEIVKIAQKDPDFVIRIHAGENNSLKDNVANSVACVKNALEEGQTMPKLRIGHGLYTCSLHSKKGEQLLSSLRENNVVLEFQLTSNVRLNNLNSLKRHPLHEYLKAGIPCVQGTDGGALYGTNSIDEQLSLSKLLHLTLDEQRQMKQTDSIILADSERAFLEKATRFRKFLSGHSLTDALLPEMKRYSLGKPVQHSTKHCDSTLVLEKKIKDLPWDSTPIILAGGSFNTQNRRTRMSQEGCQEIRSLLNILSPDDVFFVIGHTISGYEKYLLEQNKKGFKIYSFVPSIITSQQEAKLQKEDIFIRVSTEQKEMGLYKSFNYEIFERRPSVLIAMDGNAPAENLIQEARNGKGKSAIFIWDKAKTLEEKAISLEGYVHRFGRSSPLNTQILEFIP